MTKTLAEPTLEEILQKASDVTTQPVELHRLLLSAHQRREDESQQILATLAQNANCHLTTLAELVDAFPALVMQNPALTLAVQFNLLTRELPVVQAKLVQYIDDAEILEVFAQSNYARLREAVASCIHAPPDLLVKLADDPEESVKRAVTRHAKTPIPTLVKLATQYPSEFDRNPLLNLLFLENRLHEVFSEDELLAIAENTTLMSTLHMILSSATRLSDKKSAMRLLANVIYNETFSTDPAVLEFFARIASSVLERFFGRHLQPFGLDMLISRSKSEKSGFTVMLISLLLTEERVISADDLARLMDHPHRVVRAACQLYMQRQSENTIEEQGSP